MEAIPTTFAHSTVSNWSRKECQPFCPSANPAGGTTEALLTKKPHHLIQWHPTASRSTRLRLLGEVITPRGRGMTWNAGALAVGTVLLALALGGVRGLVVVITLFVFYWLLRSIRIAGAAHDEKRSQEHNAHQHQDKGKDEQERQSQAEQECETERWGQRQSERAEKQSQENDWWSVLEVPPHATADEIRRAYRYKIKQCHPDRIIGLAPELLELAERSTRTLNAAYSEANRACRNGVR